MKPAEHTLYCYKGQTYSQSGYFKENGQPIDLTGLTARAQIRPLENDEELIADFDVSVVGSEGKVTLRLSDEVTAEICPGAYFWDLRMEDQQGEVAYYIKGKFIVSGRVTI